MERIKVWMSWSSGKDSAYALHLLRCNAEVEVVGLLTTVSDPYERVAMHAVREELLECQAHVLGLTLYKVRIPKDCSNEVYEARMKEAIESAIVAGVKQIAFGDLFLDDVRAYREKMLAGTGIAPVFPLWKLPTHDLAREMIHSGLRAILTCVDPRKLPAAFAGREFDENLLDDLPSNVDPCGENGEFHTFVFDGPGFANPIAIAKGEVVERDGFVFSDVTRSPNGSKHCVRCHAQFTCGASNEMEKCWCTSLPPLKVLPKDLNDCLCRVCLERELAGSL